MQTSTKVIAAGAIAFAPAFMTATIATPAQAGGSGQYQAPKAPKHVHKQTHVRTKHVQRTKHTREVEIRGGGSSKGQVAASIAGSFIMSGIQGRYRGCEGDFRLIGDGINTAIGLKATPLAAIIAAPLVDLAFGEIGSDLCRHGRYRVHYAQPKTRMVWTSDGRVEHVETRPERKAAPKRTGATRTVKAAPVATVKAAPRKATRVVHAAVEREDDYVHDDRAGEFFMGLFSGFTNTQWGSERSVTIRETTTTRTRFSRKHRHVHGKGHKQHHVGHPQHPRKQYRVSGEHRRKIHHGQQYGRKPVTHVRHGHVQRPVYVGRGHRSAVRPVVRHHRFTPRGRGPR
jgi:hypothetical protein